MILDAVSLVMMMVFFNGWLIPNELLQNGLSLKLYLYK